MANEAITIIAKEGKDLMRQARSQNGSIRAESCHSSDLPPNLHKIRTVGASPKTCQGRNGCARVPDASRAIVFEETDASRTRPEPFLPGLHQKCSKSWRLGFDQKRGNSTNSDLFIWLRVCSSLYWVVQFFAMMLGTNSVACASKCTSSRFWADFGQI
eukprot:gene17233-biopygen2315